nr:hypothetical protein [Tanacetum cinerariifolium]
MSRNQVTITTIMYPEIHSPSQEISDEVFQAKGDLMKSIQTFLEEFNYVPFGEKPKILLQAWDKFFAIRHAQLEDSNKLFQKLLEDLQIINKELAEYVNSPSRDRPIFFDNDKDHSVQYKEYLENSFKEIAASNTNQEKEGPPQDFDIRQLIREECCIEVCEDQRQNMENTIMELVKICQQKELYCMHDNVDDLIESDLNSKLLSINLNSQRLDKKKQEVKNVIEQPNKHRTRIIKSLQNFRVIHKSSISLNNTSEISPVHAIAPILSTKEPECSLTMRYEHPITTLETESDEIIKSSVEELVPISNECEVTSEDKRECDVLVCEDSSTFDVCDNHFDILSDSNYDDDISSDDVAFEDIEYIEASLPDPKLVSLEEENDVHQEEEEFNLEDIQDVILHEKLVSINRLIVNIESLNDNPTPDRVLNDETKETRSDNTTTHSNDSLPEYDSFCFEIEPDQERLTSVVKNDISDDSTNDPLLEEVDLFLASDNSIPPAPDAEFDFEPDAGEQISVVINNNDELECLDQRGEIDEFKNVEDDDYFPFIFVIRIFLPYLIYSEVFLFLLSAESEDTIFDPGICV